MNIIKKLFGNPCEHNYELIDKEIKEPIINEMMKNGLKKFEFKDRSPTIKYVSRVFKCSKCNKIWIDTIQM
jgi:hypothetical protein